MFLLLCLMLMLLVEVVLMVLFLLIIVLSLFTREDFYSIWNEASITKFNNCYAYAFNDVDLNRKAKPEPGFRDNLPPVPKSQYSCNTFIERIIRDYPDTYFVGNSVSDADSKCRDGYHKVYLTLDTEGDLLDFHLYKQDVTTKLWSHKPGSLGVMCMENGAVINNPMLLERRYDNDLHYNMSCGFLCTKTKKP
jgi:hypothetical protein